MTKRIGLVLAFLTVLTAATARAANVLQEDLSACKLPHGQVLLPLPGADQYVRGGVYRFSDGRFAQLPLSDKTKTGSELLQAMRQENTGDLLYAKSANGTFLVVSGKAADAGDKFLYEVGTGAELAAPAEVGADPAKPSNLPGTLEGVQEGHTFVLATNDGKCALLRVLRKDQNGALIQWVYQADGSRKFDVPKGALGPIVEKAPTPPLPTVVAVAPPLPPVPVTVVVDPPKPPVTAAPSWLPATPAKPDDHVLEPFFSMHLAQRERLIAKRVALLKTPPATDAAVTAKYDAMVELGQLKAAEAVEPLVQDIAFLNVRAKYKDKEFSVEAVHPAVGALEQIGKPASLACVRAIGTLAPDDPAKPADQFHSATYQVHLLARVIQVVEGPEVGALLLRNALAKADPAHRPLYELALHDLQTP